MAPLWIWHAFSIEVRLKIFSQSYNKYSFLIFTEDKNTKWFCVQGDISRVRRLLDEGRVSVNETTEEGESLLSLACSAGYYELAQVQSRGYNLPPPHTHTHKNLLINNLFFPHFAFIFVFTNYPRIFFN